LRSNNFARARGAVQGGEIGGRERRFAAAERTFSLRVGQRLSRRGRAVCMNWSFC